MPRNSDTIFPVRPYQGYGMLVPSPHALHPTTTSGKGMEHDQRSASLQRSTSGEYSRPEVEKSRATENPNSLTPQQKARSGNPSQPNDFAKSALKATNVNDFDDKSGYSQFRQSNFQQYKARHPDSSRPELELFMRRDWWEKTPEVKALWAKRQGAYPAISNIKTEPRSSASTFTTPALATVPAVEEPPLTSAELEEQKEKSFQLQVLLKDASPKMLEDSVEQGVKLLDKLRTPLAAKMENSPDAEQWIKQIDDLRKQAVKTRTIIGVVGNTGAGKSSVINAMLDEERLVPTNCMRACTAVVTEISYNTEEIPYRAQIEFISSAEWERELRILFQDLLDGNGQVSRDCANEDTDAGIAYAKIKAVYPQKTKEDIANSNVETMLRQVSSVLGSTRDVEENDSLMFYKKLQHFVDSKEKSTGLKQKGLDKKKEKKEMEYWPLIRVVRIHVKSAALATGAVIVDLPGVHDANAARAAVAEGYMKQCTGLWIVAPINRAVDDKAAKSLLGESFKRQLKMDGGFNSVTFICSKTDDISIEEAQTSLGLDEEMEPSWAEMDDLRKKQKTLKRDLEEMQDTKAVYAELMNDSDEQIEVWDTLREKFEEGEPVYPPKPEGPKKRKATDKEKPRKKQRRTRTSDDEDTQDSDFQDNTDDGSEEFHSSEVVLQEGGEPLNEEQITERLHALRTTRKDARSQKLEITDRITTIRKEISEAQKAEEKIDSEMAAMCIAGRNNYSKGAIQQDFAAGIKELDQELAAEEDEASFNPDVEMRDYGEVARGLPVFCVSSRGYQKLQGRLRKDPNIGGFKTIEETEIPQLQAHCEKLTETGRSANCRSFINKLSQLLNSLTLWASSDGTGANMTAEQKAREARYLQKGLKTLEDELEKAVRSTCRELSDEFADNIFDKYETAISNASNAAIETALQWGAPVNRENRAAGGLHWSTYKAICRRNGIYTNSQGPHEWNAQLAFSRRLPMVMATFNRTTATALKKFHRDIEGRARKIGASIAGLSMLQNQVATYETTLKDYSATTKDNITAKQKDLNREFTPVIEQAMQNAYEVCVEERGTGSYARMKTAMNSHVAVERHTMFQRSADNVKSQLHAMVKDVEGLMDDKANEVFECMKRDYRAVLGGGDVPREGGMLPREQRLVRREIMRVIDGVEKTFMKVAGLSVEDDTEEENGEADQGGKVKNDDEDSEVNSLDDKDEVIRSPSMKREATPSAQLADDDESPRPASARKRQVAFEDQLVQAASAEHESEPDFQSPEI
ncbi:hypothetical protein P7C71_g2978, partial [Lecanoromycetidae sp. Uapishka_2]